MRSALRGFVLGLLALTACHPRANGANDTMKGESETTSATMTVPTVESAVVEARGEGPVRTEDVPVPGDRPAVVVRGAKTHRHPMLFVPGMCVHPGGYVMSFQHAAAEYGDLVSVQGDVSCGGDGSSRMWSWDLDAMNRRIDAAFEAAGLGPPRDVLVIGYSQGAERAEKLVARWPQKYSRAILMASPVTPSPAALRKAHAVVTMAGTHDISRPRMRATVGTLQRVHVRSAFFELPGARHGGMGEHPEGSMREALDFVFADD